MACEHHFIDADGSQTCILCGLSGQRTFAKSFVDYSPMQTVFCYQRVLRFKRLMRRYGLDCQVTSNLVRIFHQYENVWKADPLCFCAERKYFINSRILLYNMLQDLYKIDLQGVHGPPLKDCRRVAFQNDMYCELKRRVLKLDDTL